MKARHLIVYSMFVGAAMPIRFVYGQQSPPELDLTMRVMREGQRPDGFINQIELPPPSFFESDPLDMDSSTSIAAEETAEEARAETDSSEETVTDSIRESLSIDGTGSPGPTDDHSSQAIVDIPESVTDIVNNDLPLEDTLQDTLDRVGNNSDQVVNDIVDVTSDATGDVTESVGDLLEESDGGIDDLANDTVDALNSVSGNSDDLSDLSGDELTDTEFLSDEVISDDDLAPSDELTDDLETQDLMEQSVNDVIDSLPGISN